LVIKMHKFVIVCLLLVLPAWVNFALAENSAVNQPVNQAYLDLKLTKDTGAEWQMEVRQVPLAQVIDKIAKQTQVPIHYSVLPEGLVTATCVGSSLHKVLACVLNHKADLIVRYPHNKKNDPDDQIAEAWVLGSKLDGHPVTRMDCVATQAVEKDDNSQDRKVAAEEEQFQTLLKMANSDKATERAEAMGSLLGVGRDGDKDIKDVLEKGLQDQDASVRAQAVSTLTHRGDYEQAASVIQDALKDSSVDVRMMAVDGITDDAALLQQAVNDSDETVSSLAAMKLEELMKQQKKSRK
jgi:HEAT repeats